MDTVLLSKLGSFAREVLARLPEKKAKATFVALQGELGAGKTTFVQTLAKQLRITEKVQSPTYVLMKRYNISNQKLAPFKTLIHVDAYRIEDPKEFSTLRPEQFLNDPENLVVVEWPEKLGKVLPKPDLVINFSSDGAGTNERLVEIVT